MSDRIFHSIGTVMAVSFLLVVGAVAPAAALSAPGASIAADSTTQTLTEGMEDDASAVELTTSEYETIDGGEPEWPTGAARTLAAGFISGRVSDMNNNDVAGATVTVLQDGKEVTQLSADKNGEFVAEIPAGEYRVTATAEGYDTGETTATVESGSTTAANIIIQAQPDNDRFELNDDFESATLLNPGTYTDLQVVDGEHDFYAITLERGESLDAAIDFSHAAADLDMRLYGPAEESRDGSTSTSDGEAVSVTDISKSGTYYVSVYGFSGATAPYNLTLAIESSDDPALISGRVFTRQGDIVSDATVTVTNRSSGAIVAQTTTTAGVYTVEVPAGVYRVTANATGYERGATTTTVEPGSTVSANVVVEAQSETSENDRFESNNGFDTATPLRSGTYTDLRVVRDENDIYAVTLAEGDSIEASIDFSHETGDLEMRLLGPELNSRDGSFSESDGETVSVADVSREGQYYIEVSGSGGASVPYSLEVAVNALESDPVSLTAQNGVAIDDGFAYLVSGGDVLKVDLATRSVTDRFAAPDGDPTGLAYGAGSLWFVDADTTAYAGELLELDPETGRVRSRVLLDYDATGLAFGDESLWVTDTTFDTVRRYDTDGDQLDSFGVQEPTGQSDVSGLAYGDGTLWLGTQEGLLYEFTPDGGLSAQLDDRVVPYSALATNQTALFGPDSSGELSVIRQLEDSRSPDDSFAERRLSASEVQPGGEVTVMVDVVAQEDRVTVTESFAPPVEGATVESVTVEGETRTPIIGTGDSEGIAMVIDDLESGQQLTLTYTIEVGEDAAVDTARTVTGEVTSGRTIELGLSAVTITEDSSLEGTAGEYDTDNDGQIGIVELGVAAADYANGGLSVVELGRVASSYAN